MIRGARLQTIGAACFVTLVLVACVPDTNEPRLRGSTTGGPRRGGSPLAPIATPVPDGASLQSRVQIGVVPLGTIPYDGATLPLCAPSGTHLVTQIGTPPPWEAVLASGGPAPSLASGLAVFSIEPSELVLVRRLDHAGLMLGRSCNDRGYLVEQPRPDGSRRIGFVEWDQAFDRVQWLVDDGRYNAHATLTDRAGSSKGIIYSRQAGGRMAELVVAAPGRPAIVYQAPAGAEVRFPVVSAGADGAGIDRRGAWVAAIQHGAGETRLISFRTDQGGVDPVGSCLLVGGRDGANVLHGYQASASVVTPGSLAPGQVTIFHPTENRMVTLVGDRFERVWRWSARSFASSSVPGRAGQVLGTPNGLRFQASPLMQSGGSGGATVAMVAGRQIPRVTDQAPDFDYLLLGAPEEGAGNSLEILRLRVLRSAR